MAGVDGDVPGLVVVDFVAGVGLVGGERVEGGAYEDWGAGALVMTGARVPRVRKV